MFMICLLVSAMASPQAGLSLQQSTTFEEKYLAEGIVRAHFKTNEANLYSDIWLEVSDITNGDTQSSWNILIQELTWVGAKVRVGYQVHRWGQLDFLSASDVVSPKNMTWGPLTPLELQRKANPSIVGRFQALNLQVQPAVHFGPASNNIPISSNRWSMVPTGKENETLEYLGRFEGEQIDELFWTSMINSLENPVSNPFVLTPKPASQFPLDFTMKASSTTSQRTIGVGMGWIRSRMLMVSLDPVIKDIVDTNEYPSVITIAETVNSIERPITFLQPHTFLLSSWYSQLIGRFGIRIEGSHQNSVPVQKELWNSEIVSLSQVSAGVDTFVMGRTSLTSEHRVQFIHQDVQPLWLTQKIMLESAFSSQSSYIQNRLLFKNIALYNWSFKEAFGLGEIKWKFNDSWSVELGGVVLFGQAPEDFNQRIGYTGGQIGYFSDNDGLYINANWIN